MKVDRAFGRLGAEVGRLVINSQCHSILPRNRPALDGILSLFRTGVTDKIHRPVPSEFDLGPGGASARDPSDALAENKRREPTIHTQTIEGFFSIFKRGMAQCTICSGVQLAGGGISYIVNGDGEGADNGDAGLDAYQVDDPWMPKVIRDLERLAAN